MKTFFLDLYLKSVFKEILFIKNLVFEKKMKSDMKLNSEHFIELATLEINVICRMQYFF